MLYLVKYAGRVIIPRDRFRRTEAELTIGVGALLHEAMPWLQLCHAMHGADEECDVVVKMPRFEKVFHVRPDLHA